MSTKFEDRIARLNAKHGAQSNMIEQSYEQSAPSYAPPSAADAGGPVRRPIAKYLFVGLLILVVLPVGAAFGSIYYAQNKDVFASLTRSINLASFGL